MHNYTARQLAWQALRGSMQGCYQLAVAVLCLVGCTALLCKALATHASKQAARRTSARSKALANTGPTIHIHC